MNEDKAEAIITKLRPVAEALLPPGATPLEKALLTAELARLTFYHPEKIGTIWNPWQCPEPLLPWLAWAVSVDLWETNWPSETKRKVIAASPRVHRLKGTRLAVEIACEALGYEVEIVEWWQEEPVGRRGTFIVDAFQDSQETLCWSPEAIDSLRRTVSASKPLSRAWYLRANIAAQADLGLGAAGAGLASSEARGGFAPSGKLRIGIGAAALGQIIVEARAA